MSREKPAKTSDLKAAIEHMVVEHDFSLDCDVLVGLGDDLYKVTSISHWHVEPNLQLEIHKVSL